MKKVIFQLEITEKEIEEYNDSMFMEKFQVDGKVPLNKETAKEIASFIFSKDWDFPVMYVEHYFKITEE